MPEFAKADRQSAAAGSREIAAAARAALQTVRCACGAPVIEVRCVGANPGELTSWRGRCARHQEPRPSTWSASPDAIPTASLRRRLRLIS